MFTYHIYLVFIHINTSYSRMFVCLINGHIYLVYMCIYISNITVISTAGVYTLHSLIIYIKYCRVYIFA